MQTKIWLRKRPKALYRPCGVKRIGFISSINGTPWAGCEELWARAAARLAEQGYSVSANICYLPEPTADLERLRRAGCNVVTRPLRTSLRNFARRGFSVLQGKAQQIESFPGYRAVRTWLRRFRPALVVISQEFHTRGVEWMLLCRTLGIPYVTVVHAAGEVVWPEDQEACSLASCLEGARACYFVSNGNLQLVRTQLAAALPHAIVVRNPFNVSYDAAPSWPEEDHGYRLACVARLHPQSKGQDILLDVLAADKWRRRPLQVNLFGTGPNAQSLAALKSLKQLENVTFKGFINAVEEIWAQHHGLILPSRYEGLPIALVEAMLCSRMAIVTDVAGNAEVVEDGVSGFVARAPKAEFLDEAMERAWTRRGEWRSLGETAGRQIRHLVPADPVAVFERELASLIEST